MARGIVLHGGDDPQKGKGNFGEANTPVSCELDWSMQQCAHDGRMLDVKHWTSLSSAMTVVQRKLKYYLFGFSCKFFGFVLFFQFFLLSLSLTELNSIR